jgi:PDDEXK-like uncharacterized protein DUF3799
MIQGIYSNITPAEYHADCCEEPSLSSSIIHLICSRSPWHAWHAHPKLNPNYTPDVSDRFDLGTAFHSFILGGGVDTEVVDAPDWRTTYAKTRRDEIRERGHTPLLRHHWAQVEAMAAAFGPQLSKLEAPRPFTTPGGKPEQTLMWMEDGIACRARLDWLHDDHRQIEDLKTVGGSANPTGWGRQLFALGHDIQEAWYRRGVRKVLGLEARFRFVLVETDAPYAVSALALAPDAQALAEKKIDYALKVWRECLDSDVWPGYPTATCYADVPPWEGQQWAERLYRDTGVVDDGRPLDELIP